MKYFTHPEGVFEIKIPLDWSYMNEIAGYENKSPFSFELFEETQGAFQISCYHASEKEVNPTLPKQKFDVDNLNFIQTILPDPEFVIFIWGAVVEDYTFMAKYVCQPNESNEKIIKQEISKVKESLSTLICLSPERQSYAIGFDRFEKFNASLAASFDLKNKAMDNKSFIELIIINANQIDAYLRLCVVFKIQIFEKSDLFKLEYLFQSESDKPLLEKRIYDKAKEIEIISVDQHKRLYELYNLRNKVVHRYIITDLKTIDVIELAYEYELLCEEIRQILEKIEEEQFNLKIGYHALKHPHRERDENYVNELFSMINDKHFSRNFHREI